MAGWLNVLMLAQDGDSVAALPNLYEGSFLRQGSGVGSIQVQMAHVTLADGYSADYSWSAAGSSNQFATLAGASTLHGWYGLSGHGVSAAFSRGTYTRNACNTSDCVSIGLITASMGVSVAQTAAAACTTFTGPLCGSAAAYLTTADMGLNAASLAYAGVQYASGSGSAADLAIDLADSGQALVRGAVGVASVTPGVGVISDLGMLVWELLDPMIPNEQWGGPKGAK